MTPDRRLLLFLVLVMGFVIVVLTLKMNRMYKVNISGTTVYYTDAEIIQRIKQSEHYKGDSVYLDHRKIFSRDVNMQSNLNEMYNREENSSHIMNRMKDKNQPVQYFFYELAAYYYNAPAESARKKQ